MSHEFEGISSKEAGKYLKSLMKGNADYLGSQRLSDKEDLPKITVVSCSDSREPIEAICYGLDKSVNIISALRVPGQVFSQGQIAALDESIRNGSEFLLYVGHSSCGAVNAAFNGGVSEGYLTHLTRKAVLIHEAKEINEAIANNTYLNFSLFTGCSSEFKKAMEDKKMGYMLAHHDIGTGELTLRESLTWGERSSMILKSIKTAVLCSECNPNLEKKRKSTLRKQKPFATIMAPSNIGPVNTLLGCPEGVGELFAIQSGGLGRVEKAALEYGVLHLGTGLVLVMDSFGNGRGTRNEAHDRLKAEMKEIRNGIPMIKELRERGGLHLVGGLCDPTGKIYMTEGVRQSRGGIVLAENRKVSKQL